MEVNWISVGLRLPTEQEIYLVTVEDKAGETSFTATTYWSGKAWAHGDGFDPERITHWADMPQPAQAEPIQVGAMYTRAELERDGIETISFEMGRDYDGSPTAGCDVKGHGTYEESSVLAGQWRKVHLQSFDTEAEARAAYPFDDITQGATGPCTSEVPHCPPSDWSPDDAGEHWGEDDY